MRVLPAGLILLMGLGIGFGAASADAAVSALVAGNQAQRDLVRRPVAAADEPTTR